MKIYACALALLLCSCTTTEGTPDGGGDDDDGEPDSGGGGVEATFTSLYADYLGGCDECHTPTAPGRTSNIEQTLDFTSRATAYTSITTGMAAGLTGNFSGCNGVPFVGNAPSASLLLASLDGPTRTAFDLANFPDCDMDSISDETARSATAPSAEFIAALKDWLTAGTPDN